MAPKAVDDRSVSVQLHAVASYRLPGVFELGWLKAEVAVFCPAEEKAPKPVDPKAGLACIVLFAPKALVCPNALVDVEAAGCPKALVAAAGCPKGEACAGALEEPKADVGCAG